MTRTARAWHGYDGSSPFLLLHAIFAGRWSTAVCDKVTLAATTREELEKKPTQMGKGCHKRKRLQLVTQLKLEARGQSVRKSILPFLTPSHQRNGCVYWFPRTQLTSCYCTRLPHGYKYCSSKSSKKSKTNRWNKAVQVTEQHTFSIVPLTIVFFNPALASSLLLYKKLPVILYHSQGCKYHRVICEHAGVVPHQNSSFSMGKEHFTIHFNLHSMWNQPTCAYYPTCPKCQTIS